MAVMPRNEQPVKTSGNAPLPWRPANDVFGQTYSLLRWSMPVLFLWLVVAIAFAWGASGVESPMTSISAYYYTSAQTVFVGVIISLGVLLIVIQGRTPWEDALMNTAGALAPFVALLPTPVTESDKCAADYCTSTFLNGVIPDNREIIAFNFKTAIPIWLILCVYLIVRTWSLRRAPMRVGYSSSLVSVVMTIMFGVGAIGIWYSGAQRQLFYDRAHFVSAGVMVALLVASMVPFANWMGPSPLPVMRRLPRVLNNAFWLIFWLTIAAVVACLAIYCLMGEWHHFVLFIEIAALAPFLIYWVLQGWALRDRGRTGAANERES
ncbi:hypothetical protein [Dietzia maris]|uniref:hypothetical protein n=1 Tax=Dietzia maris TaxID=37915 RepID=UPI0037C8D829